MSPSDVILLSATTTVVVLLAAVAVRDVWQRFVANGPASAVIRDTVRYTTPDPARVEMAARVQMCSNGLCARPLRPDKARAGYLCPSCAGIGAPPYLPRS